MHFKVVTKGFEDSTIDQLLYNTLFLDITYSIKLNLATGRGYDGKEFADTRRHLPLFEAQPTPAGVPQHILKACNQSHHAHAPTLAHLIPAPPLLGDFTN